MDMSLSKLWEIVKEREAWCDVVHGVTKSRTLLITKQQQTVTFTEKKEEIYQITSIFKKMG